MEDISLIINQLGEERDLYYQAVSPPIMQTSNFAFKDFASMRSTFEDEYAGDYIYTKAKNPTVDMLRLKLAALQGAEDALRHRRRGADEPHLDRPHPRHEP